MPLRIPAPVKPGGHLRILSPGMPTMAYIPDRVRRGVRVLADAGWTVSLGANALLVAEDGLTAGTAADRARDLMDAFLDPSVDAILAADAGLGSRDLLEALDPEVIAAHPKPFIGYCDNVFLNYFLATRAGIGSLYGATFMVHIGEAGGAYPETLDFLARALDSSAPLVYEPVPTRTGDLIDWYVPELERVPRERDIPGGWTWLRTGKCSGPLLGGEITLLPELAEYFGLDLTGAVLFWDISYHGLEVGPLFEQLCARVDLTGLAGMIIGGHPLRAPDEWAKTIAELVDEHLAGLDCPIVVNADLSHTCPSWIVPFGERVELDSAGPVVFRRGAQRW
ncbi:S66 peptidase family protein [Paractinoplanes rishiriensis]|uniref:LD-carboxypeptidase n=1 Tax=Paractinoplanes rishiriensis TaxID=1050105 RepID=A0A919K6F2_9ACTN|nr:LD-carboxypeptidase [Actinoplanes rishiriensis]GIE99775.1 LD-carboxypeptidase [Actinoplanes rishiriensis]